MRKNVTKPSAKPARPLLPQWSLPVIFCAFTLRVSSMLFDRGYISYDDGVAAEGARLILHGRIPYRDFWTTYSPGTFYINAAALASLGERMLSLRIYGLLCGVPEALIFYAILRRVASRTSAAVAAAAMFVTIIPLGGISYWLTAVLAAVYSLVRFLENPESRWCYLCGLFVGLTVLLRQDAGAYLAVPVFAFIYAGARPTQGPRFAPLLKALAACSVTVGSVVAYLAANGAFWPMVDFAIRFAVFEFPKARPLPYPPPWSDITVMTGYVAPRWIAFIYQLQGFYILPTALALASVPAVKRLRRSPGDRAALVAAALFCTALIMFAMVRVRPSGARITASAIIGAAAFAVASADARKGLRAGAWAMLIVSIITFAPFGCYTIWAQQKFGQALIPDRGCLYTNRAISMLLSAAALRVRQTHLALREDPLWFAGHLFPLRARSGNAILRTPSSGHRYCRGGEGHYTRHREEPYALLREVETMGPAKRLLHNRAATQAPNADRLYQQALHCQRRLLAVSNLRAESGGLWPALVEGARGEGLVLSCIIGCFGNLVPETKCVSGTRFPIHRQIEPQHRPRMLIDYINKHYTVKDDYLLYQIYERKAEDYGRPLSKGLGVRD